MVKGCFRPVSNRGPFACEANVITTTLRKPRKACHGPRGRLKASVHTDLQTGLQLLRTFTYPRAMYSDGCGDPLPLYYSPTRRLTFDFFIPMSL